MRAWHFTEMPYPQLPPMEDLSTLWVTLPNTLYDPRVGADLYNRYLDEYVLADELGLDVMVNEHHQTATCLNVAAPVGAAILARQTRNARILVLGNPIANRNDPIRIAEEMAMIDCISHGRLEAGFVRGVPYEVFASNTNPTETSARLWEGLELITRAWTATEPFAFSGRYTRRRAINLWPRPYQDPHPPVWMTGSTDFEAVRKAAARGYVFATFLQPYDKVRSMFDTYRSAWCDTGLPGGGGTAFMPLVYTADSAEEAEKGAQALSWYLKAKAEPQFRNPPGYASVALNVKALQGKFAGRTAAMRAQTLEYQKEMGVVMYGTPDDVAHQIETFHARVGGFDHLLMMQQAGHLGHASTARSMTLFAKEVYPRIKDLPGTAAIVAAQGDRETAQAGQ